MQEHKDSHPRYRNEQFEVECSCGLTFSGPDPDSASSAWLEHTDANSAPKPLTFTLTIQLGNEGMQTQDDLVQAFQNSLSSFYGFESDADTVFESGDLAPVRDVNGNTVGSWGVK